MPHARCVVLIETCEESGSCDLPAYIDALDGAHRHAGLVVCLDSGCGNYEQLWTTTSLRGLVGGELSVEILAEGVHSGDASGIVPSSFRILRQLLSRLEDEQTGEILPASSTWRSRGTRGQARAVAAILGDAGLAHAASPGQARPRTRPGRAAPQPHLAAGAGRHRRRRAAADRGRGNVLRPRTALKLSLRIPPTLDAPERGAPSEGAAREESAVRREVRFEQATPSPAGTPRRSAAGSAESLERASQAPTSGSPPMSVGEGGSIPFMGMLGEQFPEAQFVITGVLGPGSNAHGPNEFLHVPTASG